MKEAFKERGGKLFGINKDNAGKYAARCRKRSEVQLSFIRQSKYIKTGNRRRAKGTVNVIRNNGRAFKESTGRPLCRSRTEQ